MSLYDDYEPEIKTPTRRVANPGINFLKTHLQVKKPTRIAKTTMAPVIDLDQRNKHNETKQNSTDYKRTNSRKEKPRKPDFWDIEDEYDPLHPNDFYKVKIELEEREENEQKQQSLLKAAAIAEHLEMMDEEKNLSSRSNFLSNYGYDSDDCSGDEAAGGDFRELQFGRWKNEVAPVGDFTEGSLRGNDSFNATAVAIGYL